MIISVCSGEKNVLIYRIAKGIFKYGRIRLNLTEEKQMTWDRTNESSKHGNHFSEIWDPAKVWSKWRLEEHWKYVCNTIYVPLG